METLARNFTRADTLGQSISQVKIGQFDLVLPED